MATRAEWAERVDRWERSGLGAVEFSRREGLRPGELAWWRRELRASQPRRDDPRRGATRVARPHPPPASAAPPAPAWIDIALPNGLVRLLPGVDAATLACVLAVAAELDAGRPSRGCTCARPPGRLAGVR
jgi:hypothetical protein